jgi:hypothetical protein
MVFWSFLPLLALDLLITIFMRPRSSFMLSFTVSAIAVVGTALWFCIRRIPPVTRAVEAAAPCLAIALVVVLPSHFHATVQGRPIYDDVERLLPQRDLLKGLPGTILLGNSPTEVMNYTGLAEVAGLRNRIETSALLDAWDRTTPLATFLGRRGISAVYLDTVSLSRLLSLPEAADFLERPGTFGWKIAAEQGMGPEKWMLLIDGRYATQPVQP